MEIEINFGGMFNMITIISIVATAVGMVIHGICQGQTFIRIVSSLAAFFVPIGQSYVCGLLT